MSITEKLNNLIKEANYAYGEGGIVGKDYKGEMKKDDKSEKKDGKAKFLEMIKSKKEGGKDKSDKKDEKSEKKDDKKDDKEDDKKEKTKEAMVRIVKLAKHEDMENRKDKYMGMSKEDYEKKYPKGHGEKKDDMKKEGKAKFLAKLFRKGSEEAIKKTTPKLLRKERMKGLAMGGGAAAAGTGAAAYASSDKGKAHLSRMKQKFSKKAGLAGKVLKGGLAAGAGAMAYKHKDKLKDMAAAGAKRVSDIAAAAKGK